MHVFQYSTKTWFLRAFLKAENSIYYGLSYAFIVFKNRRIRSWKTSSYMTTKDYQSSFNKECNR